MAEEEKKEETATLSFPDGKEFPIKIKKGTCGPPVLDMSTLYMQTGYFSHDPGFKSTSSCQSSITYMDAEGELLHRGYKISDLAEKCSYLEHCYLLLYGELPNSEDMELFNTLIKNEMCIHENLVSFYKSFTSSAHPMAIMVGVVGALSAFMPTQTNMDKAQRERVVIQIVAKMPMIAAVAYRTSMGLPVVHPKREYSFTKNFLYMMFADPMSDKFEIDFVLLDALEKIMVLHADHEQNQSTSTMRIAGSSMANPYACVAAGIACLWGPLHGGGLEVVLKQLKEVGSEENIDDFFHKVTVERSIRLFGFGHRVYKNVDPRNEAVKRIAYEMQSNAVLSSQNRKLLNVALAIEQRALRDPFFISRNLYPNVDFYTGIVLNCLGIPETMFTVIFAVSRCIGWTTQWNEMMSEPNRIQRPRQLYMGQVERDFVALDDREDDESRMALDEDEQEKYAAFLTGLMRKRSVMS